MRKTIITTLGLTVACLFAQAAAPGDNMPWTPLFDGKTLNGWTQRGGKAKYVVEDGTILGLSVPNTPNSFLCTEKYYSDFIFEYDFKVNPSLNSGVQIRSNSLPTYHKGRVHGYQVEIDPGKRAWSAGIYDEGRRGWLFPGKNGGDGKTFSAQGNKLFKSGDWNSVRVEAIGDHIRTWLNGELRADLKDNMTPSGFIGLQVHSVGKRTEALDIRWRNLRIKALKPPTIPPRPIEAKDPLPVIAKGFAAYTFGGTRQALAALEERLRHGIDGKGKTEERAEIEDMLVGLLQNPEATVDAKCFACRQLRQVGTAKSVPALEQLLSQTKTADAARGALERIGCPAAKSALRKRVANAPKTEKVAIINSLGVLRDAEALPLLTPLGAAPDADIAAAANSAIGAVGTPAAANALLAQLNASKGESTARACLTCAQALTKAGQQTLAEQLCTAVSSRKDLPAVRAAAIGLHASIAPNKAPALVVAALADDQKIVREVGLYAVRCHPNASIVAQAASVLQNLPADRQVRLLTALGERGDKAARAAALAALPSKDEAVAAAAAEALGHLGEVGDVPLLIEKVSAGGPVGAAAAKALIVLPATGVGAPLAKAIDSAPSKTAGELARILTERTDPSDAPLLLKLTQHSSSSVSKNAAKGLSKMGGEAELNGIVAALPKEELKSSARKRLEEAAAVIAKRLPEGAASNTVLAALPTAPPKTKASLLRILGLVGDEAALKTITAACSDADSAVCDAAVRALASWPRKSALQPLLDVARDTSNLTHNVLVLRGYHRLLQGLNELPSDELEKRYKAGEALARRDEEKKLLSLQFVLVKNLNVASKRSYKVCGGGLLTGAKYATDRDYTFTSIPDQILGATYIQVAMNDKAVGGKSKFITFKVDKPTTVWVAYDHRCTKLPSWLGDWEKTKLILKSTSRDSDQNVFKKTFPAGSVALGSCGAPGTGAMYVVALTEG